MILLATAAMAAEVGGYLRIMTRPDLEGGDGRLGYWNLYGRLLNEGPYAALELRQQILEPKPGSTEPWTSVHAKIEGGTIQNADSENGSLAYFRLSQLYALAGNTALQNVTWRLGTLDSNFGDLGLYDMRPAQVLFDTVGVQGRYDAGPLQWTVGAGDAGFNLRGADYNTVFSAGTTAKVNIAHHVELGVGGQAYYEPEVVGNRYAPHSTPGVSYEDYVRGNVVQNFIDDNPGQLSDFPSPEPSDATSWKLVGYLGFGDAGPLRWNGLYANWSHLHPKSYVTESYDGEDVEIYVTNLTDEREQVTVGTEMQLTLIPTRWDVALAGLYGNNTDGDNDIVPSDDDRDFMSAVLRTEVYVNPNFHLLAESSIAEENSHNGNTYRNHVDSLFENTGGTAADDGLEYGDSDTRTTWQGKFGFVLSPLGAGIYTRPSLRLLYGIQYSSQNSAYGNSFVETLNEYNDFGNVERHWHSVLALEAEAWF